MGLSIQYPADIVDDFTAVVSDRLYIRIIWGAFKNRGAQAPTPAPLSQTLGHGAWALVLRMLDDSNYAAGVKNTAFECQFY